MTRILVICEPSAKLNLQRMMPMDKINYVYEFFDWSQETQTREFDGVLVFHKSALLRPLKLTVKELGVTFAYMEPSVSASYVNKSFIDQFDYSLNINRFPFKTSAKQIAVNIISWWVGLDVQIVNGMHQFSAKPQFHFDFFESGTPYKHYSQRHGISMVASHKTALPGHQLRQKISAKAALVGVDVFGDAAQELKDKNQCLADFRFHIAIENSFYRGYVTEKLVDCFLTGCIPIYKGAPNIEDIFPKQSLINFDHLNFSNKQKFEQTLQYEYSKIDPDDYQRAQKIAREEFNPFIVYERLELNSVRQGRRVIGPVRLGAVDKIKRRLSCWW